MTRRVAFIVSKFPCYDEAFILREMYALSKRMEIFIFSLRKSKEKMIHDEARELLGQVVYIPYLFSWSTVSANIGAFLFHPVRYVRALLHLIVGNMKSPEFLTKSLAFFPKAVYLAEWAKKKKVDHMHAYWATYPASVAMVASEISRVPFSFTGHAHDIYVDTTCLGRKMQHASFVSTCTRQNKEHLLKVAGTANGTFSKSINWSERILVNHHGVELDKFVANGRQRSRTFQILSVGTLHDYKGFQYLIPALGRLKDKGIDFRSVIVGGGPLESDLRRHIRLLNLEPYVVMTGPLKQNEVLPYYKTSDLFVLMAQPEWHWGIPNVLVESLAAKTPVITTRFGSVEELVQNGETGLIVPPKDPAELANAIERLCQDEELRRRLAETGHRSVVERFNLNKNIEVFRERLCRGNAALVS